MSCREAIQRVFENESKALTTEEVLARIDALYPDKPWKASTIRAHLLGLSVNHPSSRHYSVRKHAFLFSLGRGRYRLWDAEADGTWVVTEEGVVLADMEDEDISSGDAELGESSSPGVALSLERDLETWMVSRLEQLESGLGLYQSDGLQGRQLEADDAGRIDILALDRTGSPVVIELKAGTADERTCAQVLRYMRWVKRELARGKMVRGFIVANDFSPKVHYVVETIPHLALKRYEVQFRIRDAGEQLGNS
ncbi:MAG: endonuclease NucS [Bacillota bacterium]|nr:endonuclease NucS [Bacillota bacterium]